MLFTVKNLNIYQTNSAVHGMNTRQQNKLHVPSVSLSSIQTGVCYSSVKIFEQLPQNILKFYNNMHTSKILLRDFLFTNIFYFIEDFLSVGQNDVDVRTFILVLLRCNAYSCVYMIFSL